MSALNLAFSIPPIKSAPSTWIVDDDGPANFHTIHEAIRGVNAGDTIFVKNGTYREHVTINKKVSLIGESAEATIIDGSYVGNVIEVTVNNVTIIGFTVRNSGEQWTESGIALNQVKDCNISRNKITANRGHGIRLYSSSYNRIIGNNITANNWSGIWVSTSANYNSIIGNNITANGENGGVWLDFSSNNSVIGNNIADNNDGIVLCGPWNNTITDNNIAANHGDGIRLTSSRNNRIFHNNFVENQQSVHIWKSYGNLWDDGYPSGGNYWSDCTDIDNCRGHYQNEIGSDGIGDTPYAIDGNNTDNYPLMGMFYNYNVSYVKQGLMINIISNSTVSNFVLGISIQLPINGSFSFNVMSIHFYVTGKTGIGFCRICIPTDLMNDPWKVFVNGTEIPHTLLPCSNMTHRYLYFTYDHSIKEVVIMMPGFLSLNVLFLFMIAALLVLFIISALLAVIAYRRKCPLFFLRRKKYQSICL